MIQGGVSIFASSNATANPTHNASRCVAMSRLRQFLAGCSTGCGVSLPTGSSSTSNPFLLSALIEKQRPSHTLSVPSLYALLLEQAASRRLDSLQTIIVAGERCPQELVERHWLYYLLHSQRANALKLILYHRGDRRIIIINVPWYLSS